MYKIHICCGHNRLVTYKRDFLHGYKKAKKLWPEIDCYCQLVLWAQSTTEDCIRATEKDISMNNGKHWNSWFRIHSDFALGMGGDWGNINQSGYTEGCLLCCSSAWKSRSTFTIVIPMYACRSKKWQWHHTFNGTAVIWMTITRDKPKGCWRWVKSVAVIIRKTRALTCFIS